VSLSPTLLISVPFFLLQQSQDSHTVVSLVLTNEIRHKKQRGFLKSGPEAKIKIFILN